jgi:hypothetical protein
MNWAEYESAKAYRDQLSRGLEIARNRLSAPDFRVLAPGVRNEIARIDAEMADYPLHLLFSCAHHGWGVWVPVTFIQTHSLEISETPSVTFNSPARPVPWIDMILHFEGSRRVRPELDTVGAFA